MVAVDKFQLCRRNVERLGALAVLIQWDVYAGGFSLLRRARLFLRFVQRNIYGRFRHRSHLPAGAAGHMAADVDCDRQTGHMGGLLLNGNAQTGRGTAKALRAEAGRVDGVQQLIFQRSVIRVGVRLVQRAPQRRFRKGCAMVKAAAAAAETKAEEQPAKQETVSGTAPVAAIGGADGPTEIKVADKVDLWKPVISELNSLGETTSQEDMSWIYIFITGFAGGLLALFTPCVWPIIPMTVSFFLKRSKDKKKGIRDAWTYGASIVVIYVTLGLAITLVFGASALNALSTNAVFNILFCLMLVVFAASFFGAFEITLPSKWSTAVDSKAEATSGLLSIFLMAFTLSLVSFSCTGPIIGFLLVQVSTTGSVVAPAIGMLGFAIALALPFTLFALFPSWLKSMPKSGGWMNIIKATLGFLELALALKFLSVADLAYGWRILDREAFLALWIVLFALLGFYLLGKIKFPHDDDDSKVSVPRFFMALASLAFAVYMVPGLWGAPLKAVSAFAPPMQTQDFNLYNNEVHAKFDDYDLGMEYARQHGKPVMLDFTGYGCVNCRKMELAVWTNPKVSDIINNDYVLITLYVDNKTPLPSPVKIVENGTERTLRTVGDKWSYLQRVKFGANAQPFYVLIDNEGKPLNKSYSYDEDIPKYIEFLQTGLENYKKEK